MVDSNKFFCTDLAWEYGISLVGTATRGDIWFLLEYTGRWGAKAFEESSIPQNVKDHIISTQLPGIEVRTLLIRQDHSQQREGIHFFVSQTQSKEPRLYEYKLQDYVDLLNLDLQHLATGGAGDSSHLRTEPLYLICTNGKRDQCCSIYGPETYEAMKEVASGSVWQCSHIGGHNQAPITLFFPHGVNYGHTTSSEIRRLIHAYQKGEVVLHHYRGRVCFDPPVQAAEHFWREQCGDLNLPGVYIESVAEIGNNTWEITISGSRGQDKVQMRIQRRVSDYEIPITCTKKKTAPVSSFHRVN
jgi:hypothetical protein